MILEIETTSPDNWFRGEVSNAELRIDGIPIQILDVKRAEFRPYDGSNEGQLFLEDCILSFRTRGLFRWKGAGKLSGFIELRIGSLQTTVKIRAGNIASLRVVAR